MHPGLERHWNKALGALARHPRRAALAALLIVVGFAVLIRVPVVEGSMVDRISGDNPQLRIAREIGSATGELTSAAVIVRPRAISIAAAFADIAALRARLAAIDDRVSLQSVDSARDQLFLYGLAPGDPLASLLEALAGDTESGAIVSADARRFLYVLSLPEGAAAAVLDRLAQHDWTALYGSHSILSSAQLERDIGASLRRDLWLLIPVIVFSMLAALAAAFRSPRALALPVFASLASTVVTLALFSLTHTSINLVTLLVLPIVLIVGLANSCHFLATAGAVRTAAGPSAIADTLRRVVPPFFFSSLTTAIALVSLGFNDVPPIADLGVLAAATLLVVFFLVVLAAPLALGGYLQGRSLSLQHSAAVTGLSRHLVAWRLPIAVSLVGAILAGALALPRLSVDSNPRAFFPDNSQFSAAQKQFERQFYVFSPLRALLQAEPSAGDGLSALRAAGRFRDALEGQAGVRRVSLQPAVDRERAYVLTALLVDDGALPEVSAFIEAYRQSLPGGVDLRYSSPSLVYNDIDRRAMDSLLRSLGWSAALIFGAILWVFRSPRAVAATILANAAPLMLVCAVIWIGGRPLNLVTAFVFLVALGVIVDDAIHLLFCRAAGGRIAGSSIEFSVLLSTAMLCLGLMLCQLSDFPTTREFAAYCALALVAAVISNLSLLPAALAWFRDVPRRASDVEVGDR